jgi:hypothetical protein
MKLSKTWKTLTRDQKKAWRNWAKNNQVVLDFGERRRVSGHKAFTIVLNNRAIAGDAANPTVLPAPTVWLDGALTTADAGPFTENAGFIGFLATQNIVAPTKWFVWATIPLGESVVNARSQLRFVTCLALGAVAANDAVGINAQYLAVNGSWDGPGVDGDWPTPTYVWFRVHQYADGQLSPGVLSRGRIAVQL